MPRLALVPLPDPDDLDRRRPMKSKLALLLFIAAIGSTALVASAQQTTYIRRPAGGAQPGPAPAAQPNPVPLVPPTPPVPGVMVSPYAGSRPTAWTITSDGYSAEDSAVGREAHQLAQ